MSSYRRIEPSILYNAVVSGVTAVSSTALKIQSNRAVCFGIVVAGTLNATFQLMASADGTNYFDSGATIQSVAGAAIVGYMGDVQAPFVKLQITPSSGTGRVIVTGTAKGA